MREYRFGESLALSSKQALQGLLMDTIQKGFYQHFKGKRYEVIDVARHSETMEVLVVYKALYAGNYPEGSLWVRPLAMFQEMVTCDGKQMPRFRFIGKTP